MRSFLIWMPSSESTMFTVMKDKRQTIKWEDVSKLVTGCVYNVQSVINLAVPSFSVASIAFFFLFFLFSPWSFRSIVPHRSLVALVCVMIIIFKNHNTIFFFFGKNCIASFPVPFSAEDRLQGRGERAPRTGHGSGGFPAVCVSLPGPPAQDVGGEAPRQDEPGPPPPLLLCLRLPPPPRLRRLIEASRLSFQACMLVFYPEFDAGPSSACEEVVIVLDTSESMKGEPLRLAQRIAMQVLQTLDVSIRVNIVLFGTGLSFSFSCFIVF